MRIGWFLFAILVFEASALPRTHRGPRLEVSPASIAGTARNQTLQQHVMSIRGGRDKASRGPMPPDDGLDDGDFVFQTEEELREGKVVYAFLKAAAGDPLIPIFFSISIQPRLHFFNGKPKRTSP